MTHLIPRLRWPLASALALACFCGGATAQNPGGETVARPTQLAADLDPNGRGPRGNTPLHYAALRGDFAAVEALLARKADVTAANDAGATPLHYGACDLRIVRALLARGAAVDVVSKSGHTPLMTAVLRDQSSEVVEALLAAGADLHLIPEKRRRNESGLLSDAISGGDRRTIRLLLDRGVEVNPEQGTPPLALAAYLGDLETVRALLARGAKVNAPVSFVGSALNAAFYSGAKDVAAFLIERGADLHRKSPAGHGTPPMVWSAYDDDGDPTLARLLLQRKVDPNEANEENQTALAWALRRGPDTPLVRLLRAQGAQAPASDRPKAIPQREIPAEPAAREALLRDRAQRAVNALQHGSRVFLENKFVREAKCISCHQQTLPAVAFSAARERGIRVDDAELGRLLLATLDMISPRVDAAYLNQDPVPDPPVSLGYSLDALAALGHESDEVTEAMSHFLLITQRSDGHWASYDRRPPMEDGPVVATAWAARAVQLFPPVGRAAEVASCLARARRWLAQQQPASMNERIFQLLGLAWAGETPAAMAPFARELLANQRADGGWAQLPALASDAWATGSALVALHKAGIATTLDAWKRGADFLLRTQFDDGSWFVRSRTWPFQPHFDGEFPHGKDQWISAGGTAWATIALLYSVEPSVRPSPLPGVTALIAKFKQPPPTAAAATPLRGGAASAGPSFSREILPLFERSCAKCHSGEKPRGGLSLATRELGLKGGQSGEPAILPGQAAESPLLRYVADKVEDLEMPPLHRRDDYPALSSVEIALVRGWIEAGARWDN